MIQQFITSVPTANIFSAPGEADGIAESFIKKVTFSSFTHEHVAILIIGPKECLPISTDRRYSDPDLSDACDPAKKLFKIVRKLKTLESNAILIIARIASKPRESDAQADTLRRRVAHATCLCSLSGTTPRHGRAPRMPIARSRRC